MLAEMEAGTSGGIRREIRRSLFRLRQHGIEPQVVGQNAVARPGQDDAGLSGLSGMMSVADADGARIVWLVKSRAGGGIERLWALISEKDGLLAVTSESLSRRELRSDRAELEESGRRSDGRSGLAFGRFLHVRSL